MLCVGCMCLWHVGKMEVEQIVVLFGFSKYFGLVM